MLQPFELRLPEALCGQRVLLLQPLDEIAEAIRRGQLARATFACGVVDLEKVSHQQRAAPGIDQDVVVAHDEAVGLVGQLDQLEADRRCLGQVETGLALFAQQLDDPRLGLRQRQVAEVEQFDLDLRCAVNHLQ
ncbi:hypothetical protein D3C77_530430 [compost metagenome]